MINNKWVERIEFANSGLPLYVHLVAKRLVKTSDHVRLGVSRISSAEVCENPVFIISFGRSGSTLLFRLLSLCKDLKSLRRENPVLGHFLRKMANKRDLFYCKLTEDDVSRENVDRVRRAFFIYFGKRRFVDKLPSYCYYVRFLHAVFPEGKFLFLYRKALGNINSWMNAWRHRRFLGRKVPVKLDIAGYEGRNWVGPFFPNWRDYINASLEQVCARQWVSAHETMLEDKSQIALENRYELFYDSLICKPVETLSEICNWLGIAMSGELREAAKKLEPLNAVTAPREDKWREENPGLISVTSVTEGTQNRLLEAVAKFRKDSQWEPHE